ncbi:hypothetical protein VNI00_011540 [Paramarasmius palmivorus]|uniref:Uncharacterized protein n=1 Tax=Paramarasmius palmivorus TaxID=297713 RepID=A0AAW0CC13_9AGAR
MHCYAPHMHMHPLYRGQAPHECGMNFREMHGHEMHHHRPPPPLGHHAHIPHGPLGPPPNHFCGAAEGDMPPPPPPPSGPCGRAPPPHFGGEDFMPPPPPPPPHFGHYPPPHHGHGHGFYGRPFPPPMDRFGWCGCPPPPPPPPGPYFHGCEFMGHHPPPPPPRTPHHRHRCPCSRRDTARPESPELEADEAPAPATLEKEGAVQPDAQE